MTIIESGKGKCMANKEYRSMKVHEMSGYNYKSTPGILLKGQWLRKIGFQENDQISIHCENGRITIEKAASEYGDDDQEIATDIGNMADAIWNGVLKVAEKQSRFDGRRRR